MSQLLHKQTAFWVIFRILRKSICVLTTITYIIMFKHTAIIRVGPLTLQYMENAVPNLFSTKFHCLVIPCIVTGHKIMASQSICLYWRILVFNLSLIHSHKNNQLKYKPYMFSRHLRQKAGKIFSLILATSTLPLNKPLLSTSVISLLSQPQMKVQVMDRRPFTLFREG